MLDIDKGRKVAEPDFQKKSCSLIIHDNVLKLIGFGHFLKFGWSVRLDIAYLDWVWDMYPEKLSSNR